MQTIYEFEVFYSNGPFSLEIKSNLISVGENIDIENSYQSNSHLDSDFDSKDDRVSKEIKDRVRNTQSHLAFL